MPTTPLLNITQVTASQNNKEVTINDAIVALEAATNANLAVSFAAAASVLLSVSQFTRNYMFTATAATAAATLRVPSTVNGNPTNRLFVVRNSSGQGLTVRVEGVTGSTVTIPNGQARLLAAVGGTDIIVAAEPQTTVSFLSLTDTPATYTGQSGKFLSVNVAENALEFVEAAVFPAFASNAGKYLVVNATENGVEWVDLGAVLSFLDLTDVPASYTGQANKLVAVNGTATGLVFVDTPEAEAVEFVSATRWRVRIIEFGAETQVGFGEIELLNVDNIDLATGGTATASSFATGKEPEFAFDGITTAGNGWLSEVSPVGETWIEYELATAGTVRNVRLWPINSAETFSPARFVIEYWSGAAWVALGDRTPDVWVSGEPQTFKVNGVPLTSVADAPADSVPYLRKNNSWVGPDVDPTLAADSDEEVASQKAVKAYVDARTSTNYLVPFGFASSPEADEILLIHIFTGAVTFVDNFVGSRAYVGTDPTASYVLTVSRDIGVGPVAVGTITIATDGSVTFNTTGGDLSFTDGQVMIISGQTAPDATLANVAVTLKGTRG